MAQFPVGWPRLLRFLKIVPLLFQLSCTPTQKPLGSQEHPIRFAVIPGQDRGILEDQGKTLARFLHQETGWTFEVLVPTSYVAVVEALGSARADLAIMNTFGYLLAHKRNQARVRLRCTNHGLDHYYGQILTRKGHLNSLQDLNGKTLAYVDPASTSGYVLPAQLLEREGIKPREFIFAGTHDGVITMVYQGRIDAGATYFTDPNGQQPQDARVLVKTQFPDVFEKLVILAKTEPIPSDPIVFRNDFPSPMEEKIIGALKKYATTSEGQTVYKKLYNFDGLVDATDHDYESIRQLIEKMKVPLETNSK